MHRYLHQSHLRKRPDQREFDEGGGRDSPLPHERDVDAVGGGDGDEGNEAAHDGRQALGGDT